MKPRTYDQMVKALVMELNKSHVQYAATGAIAASYYGRPRTTTDVDFVVKVDPKNLSVFLRPLQRAGLAPDLRRIQAQLESGYSVVTVKDKSSPYDADFILRLTGPLPRRPGTLKGVRAFYQTPEELILAKLRMIKATVSEERTANDKADIQGVLANTKVNGRKIIKPPSAKPPWKYSEPSLAAPAIPKAEQRPRYGEPRALRHGKGAGLYFFRPHTHSPG